MNRTKIEWIFNPDGSRPGWSWNPITGCLNNCSYCYARKLANGRLRSRYLANTNTAPQIGPVSFKLFPEHPFYPRFWEKRLSDPTPFQKPRGIFVCDMGELFGDWLPERWQEWVFGKIRECRQHRFYLLTKQDQNLEQFSPFPDNCWVGVSATDDMMMWKALEHLQKITAKVKYISFEPLLDWRNPFIVGRLAINLKIVNWVIIGLQTPYNTQTAPKIEWIEEIVRACDDAGVPVFLKNNLRPLLGQYFGYEQRQELPK